MKNIQVIDGADNCAYDVFSISDRMFEIIFPLEGQDVEFMDEVIERLGQEEAERLLQGIWDNPCPKPLVNGIHGTVFFEFDRKKQYYPNKKEVDLNFSGRGWEYPQ